MQIQVKERVYRRKQAKDVGDQGEKLKEEEKEEKKRGERDIYSSFNPPFPWQCQSDRASEGANERATETDLNGENGSRRRNLEKKRTHFQTQTST